MEICDLCPLECFKSHDFGPQQGTCYNLCTPDQRHKAFTHANVSPPLTWPPISVKGHCSWRGNSNTFADQVIRSLTCKCTLQTYIPEPGDLQPTNFLRDGVCTLPPNILARIKLWSLTKKYKQGPDGLSGSLCG